MNIKHLPNSSNPYEACGYSRIPERPVAGESILVYCRIEDKDKEASSPILELAVNGTIRKSLIGSYIKSDAKGDYYSFTLGTYCTGDSIKYRIRCGEGEEQCTTSLFDFDIFEQRFFSEPTRIDYDASSFSFLFSDNGSKEYHLEFRLMDLQIRVELRQVEKMVSTKQLLLSDKTWSRELYNVSLKRDPLSVTIQDKDGKELLCYEAAKHPICLLMDRTGTIRNITVQSDIQAKALFGFGEKFDRVNQLGLQPRNYVYEHFTHQEEVTYLPIPFFFTDSGIGMFYDTAWPFHFSSIREKEGVRLTLDTACSVTFHTDPLNIYFGKPQEIISQYISVTGECSLPPKWSFGPWMSANGWCTEEETLEQIDKMKEYQIPATVLVLEAWSDETTFYLFNGCSYEPVKGKEAMGYQEFTFDPKGPWPDPKRMTRILHDNQVKLILWQIPVIKYTGNQENPQHVNDEAYAIEKGYCVMDKDGKPYRITDHWFSNSLVPDFSNPEARQWWFAKRRYLLTEVGVDGFKTDGGEFIYDNETVFYNGKSGQEMRNEYPNLYLEAYHEFLKECKGQGKGVLFSRDGYKGAQRFPIHWAGDQMSEFSEFRAQVKAGLSAGLSGVIFWGFDIAGFAGELPTTELYLRSAAMAAFSPVMQYHSEPRTGQFFYQDRKSWINDRSPWNMAEVNQDPKILEIYRYYANLRMNLMPYIYNEALYCCENGRPMLAHLIYDYPEDQAVLNIEDEYLFGRSLLVAPVLEEGTNQRKLYLPEGNWYEFFGGERFEGGQEYEVDCPPGNITVFVKEGHAIALNLASSFQLADYVGNDISYYQRFAMKLYGNHGGCYFQDDLGYDFILDWNEEAVTMQGNAPENMKILR